MPHSGIVYSNSPVECFLNYQDASPPQAAHIPMSRLFLIPFDVIGLDFTLRFRCGRLHILTNHLTCYIKSVD